MRERPCAASVLGFSRCGQAVNIAVAAAVGSVADNPRRSTPQAGMSHHPPTPSPALPERYTDLDAWALPDERGLQLRGRRLDRGLRPRLHVLSGNGFCGGVYWPMLRRLGEDFDLLTQDIEGHGESDPTPAFSGVAQVLQRIEHNLDRLLPDETPVGLGHSFGGALTLRLAARDPRRFSSIILLDPILLPTPMWLGTQLVTRLGRNPMVNAARRRRAVWTDAQTATARLRGRGIYAGWSEEGLASFIEYATRDTSAGRELVCAPSLEAEIFSSPLYVWRDLARVRVPVTMICGEDSYPFFGWMLRRIRRRRPDIRLLTVPGGHCFMQERPGETAGLIASLLDQTGSQA